MSFQKVLARSLACLPDCLLALLLACLLAFLPASRGNTALHWAARNGHADVCEVILGLEGFTAMNDQNLYGWTALHYMAAVGLHRVCAAILKHPSFQAAAEVTNNGETALHWAALNGREDPSGGVPLSLCRVGRLLCARG